jgi:hypothetical protein
MDKKGKIIWFLLVGFLFIPLLLSACSPGQFLGPTLTPSPTITLTSSPTPSPTETPTPTDTPPPPTATLTSTPVPQTILLRRKCGRDYLIQPNEPIQILYGAWGVIGKELADQWMTSLEVVMTIDGEVISGKLQSPTDTLPYNCTTDPANLFWLYYIANIPGLAPGEHFVSVKFNAFRALPDGTGPTLGPGQILEQNFKLITR